MNSIRTTGVNGQPAQRGLEVKVPEALVPLPRLVVPTSSKAEGLCYLHVEDIKLIGVFGYLGKKVMMVIPNPHDSVLDLHTRTTLIQLSQADDRVPQRGDIVDSGEQSVLTRLRGEDEELSVSLVIAGATPNSGEHPQT
jgi:hypothetical protein